jgi:DNA-binding transcriptional ArsR family regulator
MSDAIDGASDAFAALGDDTRVAILEALVDARREDPADSAVSFSALRERVGVEDSGRFNYHLGKLRDRFVEEADGAYQLTYAGEEVVGAILAGTHDPDLVLDPVELDDPCPICDTALTAEYEDGKLLVDCENDHTPMRTTVPPAAAIDRSLEELLRVATLATYAKFELVAGGVCFECYGLLDRRIEPYESDDISDFVYRTQCERCGFTTSSTSTIALLRHPAFVSLCHDHGIDLRERLPWTIPGLVEAETTQVADEPARYDVRIELDGDVLDATLDKHGTVLAAERSAT